eukprot:GILK01010404.1.p1 GENE.GILK01010404.1~~GILK01010404.1.p1  ORF type:complete len:328 (+),score=51.85 GILK01010404.1:49-984(+)
MADVWESLRECAWWSADDSHPYLVKANIDTSSYTLCVTDLVSVWWCSAEQDVVEQERARYNPSLETSLSGILDLLRKPLTAPQDDCRYTFVEEDSDLKFTITTRIEIYPFTWTFQCARCSGEQSNSILKEHLMIPMFGVVRSLSTRVEFLTRRVRRLEAEAQTVASQQQNNSSKRKQETPSTLHDDEFEWSLLVQRPTRPTDMVVFFMKGIAEYFYKAYMRQSKPRPPSPIYTPPAAVSTSVDAQPVVPTSQEGETAQPAAKKQKVGEQVAVGAAGYVEDPEEIERRQQIERELQAKKEKAKAKKSKLGFV